MLGDFGGQEGADDVQDGGDQYSGPGLEGGGGDRRGHRVGAVMKPVGEVEKQRGDDDHRDDEHRARHRRTSPAFE